MEIFEGKLVEGIFLEESKNRFICKVIVNENIHECYVPSSSRLENFINLKNKRVLLTINQGKNTRTRFSLFAVYYRNKLIMLNLNMVNELLELCIQRGQLKEYLGFNSIMREKEIDGYKADLYLEGHEKIVIENKAIISTGREAIFPSVHSERGILQLMKLYELLRAGYKVHYNFIALGSATSAVKVNKDQQEYASLFTSCVNAGMVVNGYKLDITSNSLKCKRMKIVL